MKITAKFTKALTSVALVGTLALAGCSAGTTSVSSSSSISSSSSSTTSGSATATAVATTAGTTVASVISYDTHYDANDLTWDSSTEVTIDLSNPTATDGVTVDNGVITITAAGNYRLTGTLADGQVVVAAGEEDVVRLILDNASITNKDGAAIDAESANETIIYTEAGTTNTITDGSTYAATGTEDPDAALYARTDLTLAGEGTLKVTGNYGDGIASGDGLTIAGGTIDVTATDDGIKGKDYVDVLGGTINVTATSDGIKSTNDTDAERGWVRLLEGTVTVTSSSSEVVAEYTSTKTISQVVVAGSSVTEGETYTISVNGSEADTATATSGAAAGGMGGMAPGGRP